MKKSTRDYPNWTEAEKDILRQNVNRIRWSEIHKLLPGRTFEAIKRRADILELPRLHVQPARRSLDEQFFSRDCLLSAYWAGFIAADGCIVTHPRQEVRIGIHQRDTELLRRFARDCGYDGRLGFRNRMVYMTVCAANQWISDLERIYRIGPRKTQTLEPPDISGEHALAYSIGIIDGDGCWAIQNRKHNTLMLVVVGTRALMEWLKELWLEHGASVGNSKVTLTRNIWRMSLTGSHAESVSRLLDSLPLEKLERKWRVARGQAFGQERSDPEDWRHENLFA